MKIVSAAYRSLESGRKPRLKLRLGGVSLRATCAKSLQRQSFGRAASLLVVNDLI